MGCEEGKEGGKREEGGPVRVQSKADAAGKGDSDEEGRIALPMGF